MYTSIFTLDKYTLGYGILKKNIFFMIVIFLNLTVIIVSRSSTQKKTNSWQKNAYDQEFSPTRPSGPSWSISRDVRVLSLFVCPLPMRFFCVVGLVQSLPRPWTGVISILILISIRALKTRSSISIDSKYSVHVFLFSCQF